MLRIFKYLNKKEILTILAVAALVVFQVWLELEIPAFMTGILTPIYGDGPLEMNTVLYNGGMMLLCALGSLAGSIMTVFLATRMAAGYAAKLRKLMFTRVESFSAAEINKFSTASLITRSTNDVTQVQMMVGMGMNLLIRAPVMAAWALIKISSNTWQFMAVTASAIMLMLMLVVFLIVAVLPKFRKIQTLTDRLNRLTRENLTGIRVVRAYNAEDYQENKFEKANAEMTKTQLFTNRSMQIMMPGLTLIMSGLTLGITLIGAFLINSTANIADKVTLATDMQEFTQYAMQAIMAFLMLVMVFIIMPRAAVSAKRILEVLDTEPGIVDGAGVKCPRETGTVEFKNVCFKYPGAEEYVLKDISFRAERGETVAFIGSTGSGKSTLISLIPRFYEATGGEVRVDGTPVTDYALEDLNNRLGFIAQKGIIFGGTVRYNTAFGDPGKEITDADIEKALEAAQAKEFVDALDGRLEAELARGGTNLSGGQQQRLSIARALAKKPEILIFDDSFSALDYKTDRKLRGRLKTEMDSVTKLIVAQRIGTIRDADKIVVLDNGEMVGCGKHDELLATCSVYREIAYSQLSKEELDNG